MTSYFSEVSNGKLTIDHPGNDNILNTIPFSLDKNNKGGIAPLEFPPGLAILSTTSGIIDGASNMHKDQLPYPVNEIIYDGVEDKHKLTDELLFIAPVPPPEPTAYVMPTNHELDLELETYSDGTRKHVNQVDPAVQRQTFYSRHKQMLQAVDNVSDPDVRNYRRNQIMEDLLVADPELYSALYNRPLEIVRGRRRSSLSPGASFSFRTPPPSPRPTRRVVSGVLERPDSSTRTPTEAVNGDLPRLESIIDYEDEKKIEVNELDPNNDYYLTKYDFQRDDIENEFSRLNIHTTSITNLHKIAKKLGLRGYSKLDKDALKYVIYMELDNLETYKGGAGKYTIMEWVQIKLEKKSYASNIKDDAKDENLKNLNKYIKELGGKTASDKSSAVEELKRLYTEDKKKMTKGKKHQKKKK